MKNKILEYIATCDPEFSGFGSQKNIIYIDFAHNPVNAVTLENLVLKHFEIIKTASPFTGLTIYHLKMN